jgi:uncharacterized surface protein with fasciclin (FAS1) repeats
MRLPSTFKTISLVTIAALSFGCADNEEPEPDPDPQPDPISIAATAQATPALSTLVAAVQFASDNGDLLNLLSNPGQLTVFAPTNDAFNALAVELTGNSGATGAALLTDANKPLLRAVLRYHVLAGAEVRAAAIPFGKAITTAEGSIFKIDAGSPPTITDGRNRTAKIVTTDIAAANGVVHVIDRVILPANKNIVETAQAFNTATPPEFKLLVEAVVEAGLVGTLSGPGPLTVFAPTDLAFTQLLSELQLTKAQLFANKPLLTAVLKYHVVSARVLKADVPVGQPVTTVETGTFTVSPTLRITDERDRQAGIGRTDVLTSNGVIHVIDKVILPK